MLQIDGSLSLALETPDISNICVAASVLRYDMMMGVSPGPSDTNGWQGHGGLAYTYICGDMTWYDMMMVCQGPSDTNAGQGHGLAYTYIYFLLCGGEPTVKKGMDTVPMRMSVTASEAMK